MRQTTDISTNVVNFLIFALDDDYYRLYISPGVTIIINMEQLQELSKLFLLTLGE